MFPYIILFWRHRSSLCLTTRIFMLSIWLVVVDGATGDSRQSSSQQCHSKISLAKVQQRESTHGQDLSRKIVLLPEDDGPLKAIQSQPKRSPNQRKKFVFPSYCCIRGGSDSDNNDENTTDQKNDEHRRPLVVQYQLEKPIEFYIFKGGLCPYAGRTWIVLQELGLPFNMVYIDYGNKPNWFLKINPRGRVPAIHNPNDTNDGNGQSGSGVTLYESEICNDYLCNLCRELQHQSLLLDKKVIATNNNNNINNIPPLPAPPSLSNLNNFCPFISSAERAKLRLFQDQFDHDIFPKVRMYIMNADMAQEDVLKKECQDALSLLQSRLLHLKKSTSTTTSSFFLGQDHFTIADAHIVPFVMRWIIQLRHLKGYNLRKECEFQTLVMWYDLCLGRQSVKVATSFSDETIMKAHYQKLKLLASASQQK